MDTLAEGVFAKKIIVGGRPAFWQLQLQRVFEKENWGVFALPPDYPDPQALLQVHNDAVILYVLPDERGPAAGEELVQRLLELLRISREQSVQGFYLISTLAAGSSAGQQPDNPDAAMAEHIVTKWAAMTGIPSGIIRLPDVYGPGDNLGESLLDRWLLAMLLAAVLLTGSLMQQGVNLVGMLYQPEILLHLVSYLFAAVLTGYFADSRSYEREAASWQKRQADERYAFLKGIYEETLSVKDRLYRQILNADDSIGRLYSIIRQLDSVELENVFTQAAVVTAQVLSVDNIVVYVVSDQYYLRQKVRLGSLAEQQPRSLRVEEHPYLQAVLQEKTIYVNRELVRSAPDLAAPIIYEGKVIAVVEILGMHFGQWNLSQQNLLSITTRLISASMGRAYQYEAEIQSRRYYGSTRIMQEAEFGKIMEDLRARQRIQHGLSIAVLEVDMTGLDYPALDAKLSAVIRSEDFLGNWQGHIYVLLPDADDDVTAMVQQRMERAGIHTTVSEEVL